MRPADANICVYKSVRAVNCMLKLAAGAWKPELDNDDCTTLDSCEGKRFTNTDLRAVRGSEALE